MKRAITIFICLLMLTSAAWLQAAEETIAVPKSEFETLKARLDQLEQEVQDLKANQTPSQPATTPEAPPAAGGTEAPAPAPETPASGGGGKALSLPDISLVVQAGGHLSSDKKDDDRNRLHLTETEIGIQGYVYPNVKADAFITGSPAEGASFQVEEAYLTYLGLRKGLNLYIGQKHVAFGRTNLLHNHSWLYTRQPLAISNLVASESLTGQGAAVSYLIPTHSNLFAQLDLGTWTSGDSSEATPIDELTQQPAVGTAANLSDRFNTARLWTSYPVTENSELELGGSWAGGKSTPDPDPDRVHLAGVDLSYRHFWEGSRRLLLRGEGFQRRGTLDSGDRTARGYYLFGNYRSDKYKSVGLLYDWSQFPQAVELHESALSLILTKQLSEQYYLRLQAIHGSRPDDNSYNELWLQWVWGVGPHTHNLE